MTIVRWICAGPLMAALLSMSGCGVQDPDQPAIGSISVKADKSNDTPAIAPGKPADPRRN